MKALVLLFALLMVSSCTDEQEQPDPINIDTQEVLDAHLDFGLDIFTSIASQSAYDDENLVMSPLSIQAALYMTLAGAEGNTESEMAQLLALGDITPNDHNLAYQQLEQLLSESSDNTNLSLSNAMFYDIEKIQPADDFVDQLNGFYDAQISSQDFTDANTVDNINAWVEQATEGRIEKVLESIDPMEAMFIINALFMKGDWQKGFNPDLTTDRPFTYPDGQVKNVPTMSADDYYLYYQGQNYTAVDLPLKDSLFSATFILPGNQTPQQLLGNLFSNNNLQTALTDIYEGFSDPQRIQLMLPKFETGSKLKLKDLLISMGMLDAFDMNDANFSDIGSASGNIFLTRVLHDTYLKVDEKGLEGAAVTTVGVGVTSIPPTVSFNKPFLFFVRHIPTNALIFTGIINQPVEL